MRIFHTLGADVISSDAEEVAADNIPAWAVGFLRNNFMWDRGVVNCINLPSDNSDTSDRLVSQLNK